MNSKMKKSLSLVLVLVMMMFCFTGCIRYRTTMTVKKNGKADISIVYALYDEIADEAMDDLDDMADDLEDEGWEVDDYKKGDYVGYEFTLNDVKLMDLEDAFDVDALGDLGFDDFSIKKKGLDYVIEWDTNAEDDAEDEGVGSKDLSTYGGFMEVEITLPYGAKKENATDVSKDGKTLTWDLTDEDSIELTFSLVNVGAIIAAVVIVVVLVAAAVVVLIIVKKKKNSSPVAASAEPVQPAPVASTYTPSKPSTPSFSIPKEDKPEEKAADEQGKSPFAPPRSMAADNEAKPAQSTERSPFAPPLSMAADTEKKSEESSERSPYAPPLSMANEIKTESKPVEPAPVVPPVFGGPVAVPQPAPAPVFGFAPVAAPAAEKASEPASTDNAAPVTPEAASGDSSDTSSEPYTPSIVLPSFNALKEDEDKKKDAPAEEASEKKEDVPSTEDKPETEDGNSADTPSV